MEKLNLIGSTFAGDKSATHGKSSKHIEWVTDGSAKISVHVDDGLFQPSPTEKRFGAIIPQIYANAPQVLDNFDCIFTHSKELLDLDPRFKFAPVGTHWIKEPAVMEKSKDVSMIASNKIMCLGHAIRHGWIQRLHDKVDFFGRGFKEISEKEQGLNDYRFSVAIENCSVPNYFTEKIGDCFATGTIPIYIGCSNIGQFFNTDGIIRLDHELDFSSLTEELYMSKLDAVKDNFERIQKFEIPEDWIYETYKEAFN
jgi:hypothetical protein